MTLLSVRPVGSFIYRLASILYSIPNQRATRYRQNEVCFQEIVGRFTSRVTHRKCRTVVETVLQILRIQPESCILVCAPSNPATDTLVLRLRPFLPPHEMLRLNDQNRTFAEVPVNITQYSCKHLFSYRALTWFIFFPDVENDKFALPPWKTLMKYRVVVCSCLDARILVAAHCTNTALMRLEQEITSSLHPHRHTKHKVSPHWSHLLIDEV